MYSYKNGNYTVSILKDGTKIRETSEDHFDPEFPESMDIKITNWCDMGHVCKYCHEASHYKGAHADLDFLIEKLSGLPRGIEIACLHENTDIFTKGGIKKIKNLTIKDFVYNEKGGLSKVERIVKSKKKTITLKLNKGLSFTCTPDHPFLTSNGDIVEAQDMIGKKIQTSQFCYFENKRIDLAKYVNKKKDIIGSRSGKINENTIRLAHSSPEINRYIDLDNDIMWLYGLCVAQGDSKCLTLNINHNDIAERALQIYNKITKHNAHTIRYDKIDKNVIVLQFSQKIFSTIFQKSMKIGSGAKNKSINFLFGLDKELVRHAIYGMFQGDGCERIRCDSKNNKTCSLSYKTASEQIAKELHYLLATYFGVHSSYHEGMNKERFIEGRKLKPSKYYKIDIYGIKNIQLIFPWLFKKGNVFSDFRLNKLKHFNKTYDFEVQEIIENNEMSEVYDIQLEKGSSHLFSLMGGIVTHNCGGGDTLSHPDIKPFLQKLRAKHIIPNITVNHLHLKQQKQLIKELIDEKLIFGLGISYRRGVPIDDLVDLMEYENAVIHLIAGVDMVHDAIELMLMLPTKKVLLLGYKTFRKGKSFYNDDVNKNIKVWYNQLPIFVNAIAKAGGVVSFDNLAIEQLNPRRILRNEDWDEFYQGEDGTHTFYIDAVKREFAMSSTSPTRYKLDIPVTQAFNKIKK